MSAVRVEAHSTDSTSEPVTAEGLLIRQGEVTAIPFEFGTLIIALEPAVAS